MLMDEETLAPQSTDALETVQIVRYTEADEVYAPGFYAKHGWTLWIAGGLLLTVLLYLLVRFFETRRR
jgi:hypothetical protein